MRKQLFKDTKQKLPEKNFSHIKITLASPDKIKSWSFGEIKNLKQLIIEHSDQKKTDFSVQEFLVQLGTMNACAENIKE